MKREVIYTSEFQEWLYSREKKLQDAIFAKITILEELGPELGRPIADTLRHSARKNLKELRIQFKGEPYRVVYIFGPKREAVLLVGGNKTGKKDWYQSAIRE